ncbi:hypothetical protein ACFVT5_08670 [Streptomyces sp. NPDC058001]|uniref:hypothetical protein n=1 Tax=Streptomyces sp. NPDC058001 TaxID=3346300 RepID=UPI0036E4E02E
MPDNTLKSQYAAQVEADLEQNIKEQDRIATEITAFQEQLRSLEADKVLLEGMRQALDARAATVGSSAAALPQPRTPGKAGTRTAGKRKAKAAAEKGSSKGAPKPAASKGKGAGKDASAAAPAGREGTLREAVATYLGGQREPRSAAEVATALTQEHPDRKIGLTVIRNTLEGLVAKGQALRTKQQRSVFYTATETAGVAAGTAAEAGSEAAPDSGTEGTPVGDAQS